jgi:hypothetical protein
MRGESSHIVPYLPHSSLVFPCLHYDPMRACVVVPIVHQQFALGANTESRSREHDMDYCSTRHVARLLGIRPGTLAHAIWEGRVTAPAKGPSGTFLWSPEDIHRASWALRKRDASDVLGEAGHVKR